MTTREHERVFKALANKRRLDILVLLGKAKAKKRTVGEVASKIRLSMKATSKHLLILRSAGFLDKEQRSLLVYYSIAKPLSKIQSDILNNL